MMFRYSVIIAFLLFAAAALFGESRALVQIKPAPEDFAAEAKNGSDPIFPQADFIITGKINLPKFAIENIRQLSVKDTNGKTLPVVVDKASVYSEFDESEINSLRIAFGISEAALAKGSPVLIWGADINDQTNREIPKINVYRKNLNKYRTFNLVVRPQGKSNSSRFATIEVIVDDYADTYYLWYLLPMALVFILLGLKKVYLK